MNQVASNRRRWHLAIATLVLWLALAPPAAAQSAAQSPPKFDVSGGYQFMNLEGDDYKGWYVDFAKTWKNPGLAVVVHVDGGYRPPTVIPFLYGLIITQTESVYEMLFGLRVRKRTAAAVMPFGQVLIGTGGGNSSSFIDGRPLGGPSSSGYPLAVLGGGVNVRVTDRIGVRLRADYGVMFGAGPGTDNTFRVALGLSVPFGAM